MFDDFDLDSLNDEDLETFLSFFVPVMYEDTQKEEEKMNTKIKKSIQVHKYIKEGPDKFIDALCVDACNILWQKNIYTKGIIVDDNKVCIVLNNLNSKNELEFEIKSCYDTEKYRYINNNYQIYIDRKDKSDNQVKAELRDAVECFKMQDVEGGYLSKDEFLMKICDCGKVDGVKEYETPKNLEIDFDENKMEKTFEEYLKEKNYSHLYVESENRVYLDDYYLAGHKRFLKENQE